ncbi:unnamed protein product [Phaedon cochleariae]|uniref:Methanethiol oxidase n=1 Tax=Phaedon cochleariae TaxID=80249 RepID=A0A9P0DN77_PHACE|nr:unnamed protein product [Phaedon cochleariae]
MAPNNSGCGPGYATPLDAMKNGPRENLLYVICVQPNEGPGKSDLLATVDVNPDSPTYCQIIHRLRTGHPKDELHHSGWNVCSSCHSSTGCVDAPPRDKLVLPALGSDRVYIVDVAKNPRAPEFHKVIESSEIVNFNCRTPHTAHCLASGDIMIATMGDKDENAKCDFILIDGKTFKTKGTWINGKAPKFNYDFWYQPYFDVMVSTEWGIPRLFKKGFAAEQTINPEKYGRSLNFFSWSKRQLVQSIDLGVDGIAPLEVRFLHDPKEPQGYVGCAVNGNIFRFYKKENGTWAAEKVIDIPHKKVSGYTDEYLIGFISDILISLDDKYLYLNLWLQGDVRQYDISDRSNPKLTGQVFIGGKLMSEPNIKLVDGEELPSPLYIKGKRFYGGPQMMQLSLDGKRLYVSSSILSPWDHQFYPEMVENGGKIIKLDIDTENGGMKVDENFLVDFGEGPDGPLLPHEMRYPGGDCTSDIWMAKD